VELGKRNRIILEKQGEVIELRKLLEAVVEDYKFDIYLTTPVYIPQRSSIREAEKYLNPATCNTP